jgi:hypothetical protein
MISMGSLNPGLPVWKKMLKPLLRIQPIIRIAPSAAEIPPALNPPSIWNFYSIFLWK